MMEYIMIGWSFGALSMITFEWVWTSWGEYRRDLKLSRCKCKEGEE